MKMIDKTMIGMFASVAFLGIILLMVQDNQLLLNLTSLAGQELRELIGYGKNN